LQNSYIIHILASANSTTIFPGFHLNTGPMKRFTLLILLISIFGSLHSQNYKVTTDEALVVAKNQFALFLNADSKSYSRLTPFIQHTQSNGDTAIYYVIGFKGRKGFVILPAFKLADPYIAISSKNNFDKTNLPPQMEFMLKRNEHNILQWVQNAHLMTEPGTQPKEWSWLSNTTYSNIRSRELVWDSVGPILTIKWDQDDPYNKKCPYHGPACDNGYALAGCGSVAMAQVMRYHEWPERYDWYLMPDQITNYSPAIAGLIADCGDAANSIYTCFGTSTWPDNIDDALDDVFDYPSAKYNEIRGDISIGLTWEMVAARNIKEGLPVIYEGREEWNISAWHIFIVDGYKGNQPMFNFGYFHINWGWSGNYDDIWFDLTEADPPSDNGPYNYEQGIIYDIKPPGSVTLSNPYPGATLSSSNYHTLSWDSEGMAGQAQNVMVVLHRNIHRGTTLQANWDLNWDTTYSFANNPGYNSCSFYFPSQEEDVLEADIQVISYGKYNYYSEKIPIKITQGEYIQLTVSVQVRW